MRLAHSVASDDHVQGTSGAAVTLVQYGDYECPYTRLSRYAVRQLRVPGHSPLCVPALSARADRPTRARRRAGSRGRWRTDRLLAHAGISLRAPEPLGEA